MSMSPEEKREFDQMKETLRRIQSATDPNFVAEMARRLGQGTVTIADGASTTGTSVAVRNAADSGSETVAEQYTGVATLTDSRGNTYRIGYY